VVRDLPGTAGPDLEHRWDGHLSESDCRQVHPGHGGYARASQQLLKKFAFHDRSKHFESNMVFGRPTAGNEL
jgi:hypothetical protein